MDVRPTSSIVADESSGEILNRSEAVASELEVVGESSHAVLSRVHRVLPSMRPGGLSVRDHHLGVGDSVEQRTDETLVGVVVGDS